MKLNTGERNVLKSIGKEIATSALTAFMLFIIFIVGILVVIALYLSIAEKV